MAEALGFGLPIKAAATDKHLTDGVYIKGGYCVVASVTERNSLPVSASNQDGVIVVGSLVYCMQEQQVYICTAITEEGGAPTATWTPYVSGSTVDPMTFMGTLGSLGTITSLPAPSGSNKGYTYKVIEAGTYTYGASGEVVVKVGDTVISDSTEWVVIPSGDEPTYQSLSELQNSSEVSLVTRGEKYTWNHKTSLALGTSSTTAFRGDYGNTAYNHSQSTHAPTTSSAAASGGTTLSLVTTGEKYTWNNKSNLTIGTTSTTAAAGNHNHDGTYLKTHQTVSNKDATIGTTSTTIATIGSTNITAKIGSYASSTHNHDGTYLKTVPAASNSVRGGIKIWVDSGTSDILQISTS